MPIAKLSIRTLEMMLLSMQCLQDCHQQHGDNNTTLAIQDPICLVAKVSVAEARLQVLSGNGVVLAGFSGEEKKRYQSYLIG